MKTYQIKRTDLVVSRIAYGCGPMGSLNSPRPPGAEATREVIEKFIADHDKEAIERWKRTPVSAETVAKAVRLVDTAYQNGITLFDHADIYSFGKSEEAFGEVLKRLPQLRDKIVIQTKCGIRFAGNMWEPAPGDPHRLDFSREHIVSSAEGSLRRLGTDRLDILLLHRPDALVEPEEVASAFDELHRSGKVRYFGVSNHTPWQIELLKKFVRQPLVVNQLHLGLAYPHLIADGVEANRESGCRITDGYSGVAGSLDYCRLHDIQVQAWSPMKGGNMGGGPLLLNPPVDAAPEIKQAAQLLSDMAQRKSATPSAVVLAWLLRHPAGIVPIIGPKNPEHLRENCAADSITLSREEWYELFVSAAGGSSLDLLELEKPKARS